MAPACFFGASCAGFGWRLPAAAAVGCPPETRSPSLTPHPTLLSLKVTTSQAGCPWPALTHRVLGAGPCKPKFFSLDVGCEHTEALRRQQESSVDTDRLRIQLLCLERARRPSGRSTLDQCGWAWGQELGAPLRPVGFASHPEPGEASFRVSSVSYP